MENLSIKELEFLHKKKVEWQDIAAAQAAVFAHPTLREKIKEAFEKESKKKDSLSKLRSAICLWLLGRYREALESLVKLKHSVAFRLRYHIHTVLGNEKEAKNALREGLSHQKEAGLLYLLAKFHFLHREVEEGEKQLKELKKTEAKEEDLLFLESLRQEALGEYEEAQKGYLAIFKANPKHWDSCFRLAYLESLYGDDEKAIEYYERCREAKPPYIQALINLAVLYEDRGRYGEAIQCLEEVLSVYPQHPIAKLYWEDCKFSLSMFYDEDSKRQMDKRRQILRIPIKHFELSARAKNCLAKMNIKTLGDLVQKTEEELLSYKNFGENSLREIKSILAQHGLTLGEGKLKDSEQKIVPKLPDEVSPELLNRPVTDFQFNNRALNCMKTLGIRTLGDLLAKSEAELLQVRNFGKNTLQNIRERLREIGLALRPE